MRPWPGGSGRHPALSLSATRIDRTTRIASAGSCFAQNIARGLVRRGYCYVVTEPAPPWATTTRGRLPASIRRVSATSTQPANWGRCSIGRYSYAVRLNCRGPTRTASSIPSDRSCDRIRFLRRRRWPRSCRPFRGDAAHVLLARRIRVHAGPDQLWRSRSDGALFPVCPGCGRGEYDRARYEFVNLGVAETVRHLHDFRERLKRVNPRARIILTVSPVPLVATIERRHVLLSTTYCKSVLRVAAQELAGSQYDDVVYFGAYEIIMGTLTNIASLLRGRQAKRDRAGRRAGDVHVLRRLHRRGSGRTNRRSGRGPGGRCGFTRTVRRRSRFAFPAVERMVLVCEEELALRESTEHDDVKRFSENFDASTAWTAPSTSCARPRLRAKSGGLLGTVPVRNSTAAPSHAASPCTTTSTHGPRPCGGPAGPDA